MIPLLFPFLADTVIAPDPDFEDIFVNEWGVVVFTAGGTTVAGAPDENGDIYFGREPYGALMVDAPVVWIHGAFFEEATFTVEAMQGELTTLYPQPDTVLGDGMKTSASWNIACPLPAPFTALPDPPSSEGVPFGWAMDFWRRVPSRDIYSVETGNYLGNFLYYEAGIPFWEPPDMLYDAKLLAGHYSPEGLLITTGPVPSVETIQLIPLPDGTGGPAGAPLNDSETCDHICGWAAGNLKSQEIEALWATWKPFFTKTITCNEVVLADRRGTEEKWILFPLPWDVVEEISTINLDVPYHHGSITYNRLFLGLVRVN